MAAKAYQGPVCFVGHDHDREDGQPLAGGWHYSVVESPSGGEMPGDRLVLEEDGSYRIAGDGDQSHRERHHQRPKLVAMGGSLGEPRSDEEWEAAYRHLDELEERLAGEGLHPHEHDHLIRTPEQAKVMREFLQQAQEQQK